MADIRVDAAAISMFESGWFGRGDAFWRWIETPEAKPYVAAFIAQRQPPKRGEPLDLMAEDDEPNLLSPDHLRELAREIEERFGDGPPSNP